MTGHALKRVTMSGKNSPKAWWMAARPKTLTGAAAPVMVALSAAWADRHSLDVVAASLCMLFALLMQVDANLVNDYFDFVRGRDDKATRLGPPRACAEGWVTPEAMRRAIGLTTALACLVGLPLMGWGGWWMAAVGAACVLFCFLYTTVLAQVGMGDILVLAFFGLVPVCVTYFIQTGTVTLPVVMLSVGMGLVTDCLLVVNNYRDRSLDSQAGKRTLVVLIGPKASEWLFLLLGYAAAGLSLLALRSPWALLLLPYLIAHTLAWRQMCRIAEGRMLNAVLGRTAACIFLYALLLSLALVAMSCRKAGCEKILT